VKITNVRTQLITCQWTDDPFFARNFWRSAAFVFVDTDEGITGIGEPIGGYFVPEAVPPIVEHLRPLLVGQDPLNIPALWHRMSTDIAWWGRLGLGTSVAGGVEMALWDLAGKILGVPVYQLLGGLAHERLLIYASGGSALWPMERTLAKANYYTVERGFRAFKLGVGYSDYPGRPSIQLHADSPYTAVKDEETKLRGLRDALGPDIAIVIDGHMGLNPRPWDRKVALRVADVLAEYGVLFFEEPLPYDDPEGYAMLRKSSRMTIAGGESLTTRREFETYINLGALDVVQPDACVTGITECQAVFSAAAAHHLQGAVHTGGGVSAGLMSSYHVAFANPNAIILEQVLASGNVVRDFLVEPLDFRDGFLYPPKAPGLGVHWHDELARKYPYRPGAVERLYVPDPHS